ncbi:phage tail protein [Edaphovirga cremea]|uniref:phage tail protein n=1 Tax=Edaphovirga cremea TaxID=2267246 RepID=UPI00398A11D3
MSQIESLTDFLTENMPPRAMHQFVSEIQDATLPPAAKALGLGQRRLGIFRYNAALSWGRFPFRECPPALVYALLYAWIEQYRNPLYDEMRLGAPDVDIEFDDEMTGSLSIVIELADEVTVIEDPEGPIPIGNKRYRLANPDIWTAKRGWMYAAGSTGAPLGDVP